MVLEDYMANKDDLKAVHTVGTLKNKGAPKTPKYFFPL